MVTDDKPKLDDIEESVFEPDYLTYADERPVRICAEPVQIGAAIGSVMLEGGIDDPATAVHPFDGKCKVCDVPLETLWRQIDAVLAPGYFPVNCCDRCYELAKVDQQRVARNRQLWETVCPTEFRGDWDNRKGDAALLKRLMDWAAHWNPVEHRRPQKGLVIHGDSSTGKTRACWQLYRRLCEDGVGVQLIEAIDLIEEMPREAFGVDCLIIDDLGNDLMDYKKEQRFLKLLRVRGQWHRPIVVTTQYAGSAMVTRFKQQGAGDAVVRRLREFCDSVQAKHTANPRAA